MKKAEWPRLVIVALILAFAIAPVGCTHLPGTAGAQATLAFVSDKDGHEEIYLINADGTGLRQLTHSAGKSRDPIWSPDGTRLAFSSTRNGLWSLYLLDLESKELQQLTLDKDNESQPSWSPDGKQIAFTSDRNQAVAVYILNLANGHERRLVQSQPDNVLYLSPSWSPNGKWISFVRVEQHDHPWISLCWITPQGKNEQCIEVDDQSEASEAAWSPDGRALAFYWKTPDTTNGEIFAMQIDHSEPKQLTTGWSEWPAWSPGGRMIAYTTLKEWPGGLWVMNSGGIGQRRFTTKEDLIDIIETPAWSPDGKKIAFVSGLHKKYTELYLIDANGSNLTRIAANSGYIYSQPTWSPRQMAISRE